MPDDHVGQFPPAGQHRGQIALWIEAKLDVDVRQSEITIDKQHLPPAHRQILGKSNGEPGLSDATLA